MEAAESLFRHLEMGPDPRRARGVRHPIQAIYRALSGVCYDKLQGALKVWVACEAADREVDGRWAKQS